MREFEKMRNSASELDPEGRWLFAGGIQVSLAKEGVLWSRGVLCLPKIVRQTIRHLQAVLDRLAAVELMLLQKPVVSGRYSGERAAS